MTVLGLAMFFEHFSSACDPHKVVKRVVYIFDYWRGQKTSLFYYQAYYQSVLACRCFDAAVVEHLSQAASNQRSFKWSSSREELRQFREKFERTRKTSLGRDQEIFIEPFHSVDI